MDDPWSSAGPSWSAPAKATPNLALDTDMQSFIPSPPPTLDVSDTWGAAPAAAIPAIEETMTVPAPRKQSLSTAWEQDGWGGNAEADSVNTPEALEAKLAVSLEMDRPTWDLSSPVPIISQLPGNEEASSQITEGSDESRPTTPTTKYQPSNTISPPQSPYIPASTSSTRLESPRTPMIDDPIQDFSSPGPSSLPQSPAFGDFGGFSGGFGEMDLQTNFGESSGFGRGDHGDGAGFGDEEAVDENSVDPWGNGAGGNWGAVEDRLPTSLAAPVLNDADDEGDEDGWGGTRGAPPLGVEKNAAEEDWEVAQRRIRLRQERAPTDRVRALQEGWREVAISQVGLDKLEPLTEEESRILEEGIRKMNELSAETLTSLSTIPPDINTYPPVVSSLITQELHTYALARPNPTPSTSLLQLAPTRRSRTAETFDAAPAPWLSRSKLGEPDGPALEVATSPQDASASRSRWSLWGRKASDRPLVTSGGGVLEVKALQPTPSPGPSISDLDRNASAAPSVISVSTVQSRPLTPSSLPNVPSLPSTTSFEPPGPGLDLNSPSTSVEPSAVSRFFSRLSRKPSQPATHDDEPHDLELSVDDFSYLSEVPSISHPRPPLQRGIGDLLFMESGRSEEIASLESMLSAKPAVLPSPLAPPPAGRGPVARMVSGGGADTPAGRMKAAALRGGSGDMDLLGGLDFASDTPVVAALSGINGTTASSSAFSAWDDFMAPDPAAKRDDTPPIVYQPKTHHGTSSISSFSTPSADMFASSSKVTPPTAPPPPKDDFSFDDFGTPRQADVSSFDDFGDFGAFDRSSSNLPKPVSFPTPTPSRPTAQQTSTPLRPAQPAPNLFATPTPRKLSTTLDHTPTLNLLNDASASKGKRWPAPPSPVAPILAPPPSTNGVNMNGGGGFPFLSPPPPAPGVRSRPGSRLAHGSGADLLGAGLGIDEPEGAITGSLGGMDVMSLGGSVTPTTTSKTGAQLVSNPIIPTAQAPPIQASKTGLSAQDLSFFDSL